ncbi:hypothetical protein F5Y08DRAFT_268958 [Xylaria arbuscula]|nr:hypothetical protein F5Y08DRAFT_268958 [Xylaria arbuscula]
MKNLLILAYGAYVCSTTTGNILYASYIRFLFPTKSSLAVASDQLHILISRTISGYWRHRLEISQHQQRSTVAAVYPIPSFSFSAQPRAYL